MIFLPGLLATTRWHNGQIRRSLNPNPDQVLQDCGSKWEESVAHSIVARSLFTPMKAVYICADQPCPSLFRLHLGGGPYMSGYAVTWELSARTSAAIQAASVCLLIELCDTLA